jgi:hypothetical protein
MLSLLTGIKGEPAMTVPPLTDGIDAMQRHTALRIGRIAKNQGAEFLAVARKDSAAIRSPNHRTVNAALQDVHKGVDKVSHPAWVGLRPTEFAVLLMGRRPI